MMNSEFITVEKLKKDGTIDSAIIKKVEAIINNGGSVVMPVDCVFGSIELYAGPDIHGEEDIHEFAPVVLISNFRMLEKMCDVAKPEFDFLHRIWPGEISAKIKSRHKKNSCMLIRMPRSRFVKDVIERLGRPLYFRFATERNRAIFNEDALVKKYVSKAAMILIIEELCKEHVFPTIIDISGELKVLAEGRISSEEIKSLYFLEKDA